MDSYRFERPNLNHLWYFYVTAGEGSIKRTSELLFVSQPTVSDQIKLLEEFFGCKLFERRNRALFLTHEGELAFEYADKIFSLSRDLTRRLKNKERLPREEIVIGLTPFMSQFFRYDQLVPYFNYSETSVHFVENERHLLLAELEEENIDILFSTSNQGLSANLKSQRIGVNKTFAVCHKKFRKCKKGFPASLNEIPFFAHSSQSYLRYDIDLFLSQHNLNPKVIGEGDDLDLFEVVTEKGLGFTIVSEAGKDRLIKSSNIIVLGELEELETSVYSITQKDKQSLGNVMIDKIKGAFN